MAVTKRLNASAKPYHSTGGYVQRTTTPPAHAKLYQYQCHFPAALAGSLPFPVVVASSPCVVPFLFPAPHHTYSLPPPLGPSVPVFCKRAPVPFSCTTDVPSPPSPPPASSSFKAAPLTPPRSSPVPFSFNAVTLPPVPVRWVAAPMPPVLPHGSAPHKLMEAQAADKVQAAASTAKLGQEPAPTARPHLRAGEVPLRAKQRTAGVRGRRRQAGLVAARERPARSPSPVFTRRPLSPPVPAPEWFEQPVTTVMIRNIPIKLPPEEMMRLLDDHCARANMNKKRRGGDGDGDGVLAAYDFLYLRMDFRLRCNMGYAFVNLTTAEAARGLYRALHGSSWKVFASKKVIEVCPARIQGREAQARHLSRATFACDTDEFLPAVFSPPRDGASLMMTRCSPANLKRVGRRYPLHPPPISSAATTTDASHRVPPASAVRRLAPPPRHAWKVETHRLAKLGYMDS